MQCPKCHNEVERGEKFCTHCGYELKKNNNTALIIAVCVLAALLVSGVLRPLFNKIAPLSVNDKFIEAVIAEDYEKAFSLTSHKKTQFINPEALKNYADGQRFDFDKIKENKRPRVDLSFMIIEPTIELPKDSKLWIDGIEITDNKRASQKGNLIFKVEEIFTGNHRVKITSPMAEDYNGNYLFDDSENDLTADNFLRVKDKYVKDIENTYDEALSDLILNTLNDRDSNLSYKAVNRDVFKDFLVKKAVREIKIVDIGYGLPYLTSCNSTSTTAFVRVVTDSVREMVLPFHVDCVLNGSRWEVQSIEFQEEAE